MSTTTANGASSLHQAIRLDIAGRVQAPFAVGPLMPLGKGGGSFSICDGIGARLTLLINAAEITIVPAAPAAHPLLPVIRLADPSSLQQLREAVARFGIPIDRS